MTESNDSKSAVPAGAEGEKLPTCRCGFDRHHHRVSRNGEYTMMGWLLLTFGISVEPTRVDWQCRICNQTFDSSTDPAVLAKRS